jgi:hypothetical protein
MVSVIALHHINASCFTEKSRLGTAPNSSGSALVTVIQHLVPSDGDTYARQDQYIWTREQIELLVRMTARMMSVGILGPARRVGLQLGLFLVFWVLEQKSYRPW